MATERPRPAGKAAVVTGGPPPTPGPAPLFTMTAFGRPKLELALAAAAHWVLPLVSTRPTASISFQPGNAGEFRWILTRAIG